MSSKRKKPIKPDEYFNNGLFEMVRYGKNVSLRNLSTPEQHAMIQAQYKDDYPQVKMRIDDKVKKLRDNISKCDPLMLLKFIKDMVMMSHLNKYSESDFTPEEDILVRAQEYVQSILVSTENYFNNSESKEDQDKRWHSVLSDTEDLYKEFVFFYHYWAAYKKNTSNISDDMLKNIVESQMLYLVRGNRYQVFELEPLKALLPPHNDVIEALFDVTAVQIIDGLEKLSYSLSQGLADAWMDFGKKYNEFREAVEQGADPEVVIKNSHTQVMPVIEKTLGEALNEVSHITGWNEKLVDALSLDVGEYHDLFDDSEFSGWPIMELPTKKKPFIKINGISYAFDYYSLFDNIYRALQKEVFRQKPGYVDVWNRLQNVASESMVRTLFSKLLPGAKSYSGNYYPAGNSLKKMNENDLLITYQNYLFIIEVKAGSFPQTPPISDFEAHIKAYSKLAQEADIQCRRTLAYIEQHKPAPFYDIDKQKKFEIGSIAEFKDVFTFSVTVENINDFAAKAEKLSFLALSSKTIVISYDDLLSYENYFDSPLYFLHFLKQRKRAIDVPQIVRYRGRFLVSGSSSLDRAQAFAS